MSSGDSGVNKAANAATSAAIAASLASAKTRTLTSTSRQSNGNSRKVTPSLANDLQQSQGNSSVALSSATAAAKSASSKSVSVDDNSAGNILVNGSASVNENTRAMNSRGIPRSSINRLQLPHHPKEQHYQLLTPATETPRGRNMTTRSVNRSQNAAATAAAQNANLHQMTSVTSHIPDSASQASLEPVAAAAKSYKSLSVSPSPLDREPPVLFSSPRRVVSSATDLKSIRSFSPAPSVRSHVSLPSTSERPGTEHMQGSMVLGSRYMSSSDKNGLEGVNIQAAARKAMVESHKLATGQAQLQPERGALSNKSEALIAARLIAERGEKEAKAEELTRMSQDQFVLSQLPQPEVLCPRPQRPTQQWMLSTQMHGNERPDSAASTSAAEIDHFAGRAMNESASPVSQAVSDLLPVAQPDIGSRTESCPPDALVLERRPSSSRSVPVSKRHITSHRPLSYVKENLSNSSPRSMAAGSSQALEFPRQRRLILNNIQRTIQPSHDRLSGGSNEPATGRSSAMYIRPSSIYGSAQASRSTLSLPSVGTIQSDLRGNKQPRLSRGSAEFSPVRTPFRTTMRKPGKKKHMFDAEKPWKHLIVTGRITETEQKRYAALWAANKGTLLPPELSDCVHNLVVRKIWERSRLNRDTLEKIW
ncbi:hypothetical protein V1509DRAFT_666766 [Lipomyces kononenkoae]